jgi:hypothetical protein
MWFLALLAIAGGCASAGEEVEPICVPGQEVFCRCESGRPAKQPCDGDGMGFGACGPCDEDVAPEGSTASGTDPGASGRPLFAPCETAGECATTICAGGYCTGPCYKPSDCPYPKAECIPNESATCAPACASDADCAGFGGTSCKGARAIDGWLVKTCR